jgi:taurine dioxygenase
MSTPTAQRRFVVRPLAGHVGAEIRGIDLHDPLDADTIDEVREVLADRGVVVFTGQTLGCEGHRTLARQLGEIRFPPDYLPTLKNDGYPEISVLSTENGFGTRADKWHADVSWAPTPPRYSILHMQVVPEVGGDTMWASQFDAYDRLSEPMKRFLEPLTVEHGLPSGPAGATHPLVHQHPITGRRALFVSPTFTHRIVELDDAESEAVLAHLYRTSTAPEAVCRWRWSEGDIAVWDNHFVLHYAITDYGSAPRTIHRIEVEGQPLIPALADPARTAAADPVR